MTRDGLGDARAQVKASPACMRESAILWGLQKISGCVYTVSYLAFLTGSSMRIAVILTWKCVPRDCTEPNLQVGYRGIATAWPNFLGYFLEDLSNSIKCKGRIWVQ